MRGGEWDVALSVTQTRGRLKDTAFLEVSAGPKGWEATISNKSGVTDLFILVQRYLLKLEVSLEPVRRRKWFDVCEV